MVERHCRLGVVLLLLHLLLCFLGTSMMLGFGCQIDWLLFGLGHGHLIGQWLLWARLAGRIVGQHNFHLNAQHTLTQQHMSGGRVDVVVARITGMDHQTVDEFHRFGTLTAQFARHDHFATLGARFHDEAQHTVAGTTHGQATDQLVTQGFGLGDGAQTTGGDLFSVQLDGVFGELESMGAIKRLSLIFWSETSSRFRLTFSVQQRSIHGCDVHVRPKRFVYGSP
jgi:hypothetical protein